MLTPYWYKLLLFLTVLVHTVPQHFFKKRRMRLKLIRWIFRTWVGLASCFERSLLSGSGGNAIKQNRTIAFHCQGGMGRTVKLTTAGDGPCNLKSAHRYCSMYWKQHRLSLSGGQIPSYTPKAVPVLGIDVSNKLLFLQSDVCWSHLLGFSRSSQHRPFFRTLFGADVFATPGGNQDWCDGRRSGHAPLSLWVREVKSPSKLTGITASTGGLSNCQHQSGCI